VPPARSAKGHGTVEKVRDIVGLYLNPPVKAVVLCVDEKTQIQALDRTQPLLPMGLGYIEGVTPGRGHRCGNRRVQTGAPAAGVSEFPTADRQGSPTRARRAPDRRQRLHAQARRKPQAFRAAISPLLAGAAATVPVHYTPTYAPWLEQVERWFGIITQRVIRRGSFSSVIAGGFRVAIRADRRSPKGFCLQSIEYFIANYNKGSAPFSWTATAESISEKLKRLCSRICGT